MSNSLVILAVDDHPDTLVLLKFLFKKQNIVMLEASSGCEALGLLKNNKIDLIVSDINMPDLDGNAFIKEVKKTNVAIPAIAFSAAGSAGKEEALISGFTRYVAKPQTAVLMQMIKDLT